MNFRGLVTALAMCAGLWSSSARAAAPEAADETIIEVAVEGNRRIEIDTILTSIGLRRGDIVTASRVRRDIKAIYATGWFDDVVVSIEPVEGGVKLVYRVDEKPAVREVRLSGNKKINEDDIREVLDVRAFTVLSDAEVKENQERIRDLYVEKGYYLVDITPKIVPLGDDQVELTYEIQENRKVLVHRVEFTGNDHLSASKIKKFMQTREAGFVPWLTSRGSFKKEALETDPYIIQQVYREEGYVDAETDPPNVYLSPDKRSIYVSFHVKEGPRYNIGKIEVQGDFVPEEGLTEAGVRDIIAGRQVFDLQDEQWRAATGRKKPLFARRNNGVSIKTGDVFKLSKVQALMASITDLYADRGYAFVNVIPIPKTDPETQTVDLSFLIDKGEKVRIGNINIMGNDPTFDKVVRREIPINEGEIYRGSMVRAARSRLERLGYFETVDISTPRGEREGELDVNVNVTEKPTGTFSLGLGFSSLESLVFNASMSKNNFLGLGLTVSAGANYSRLKQQFNASIFDPYFLDSRWTMNVSGYYISRQYQLDEYQRGGSLGIGRYLDARDDVQLSLEYTFEDVGLTSLDPYRRRLLGGDLFRNGLTSKIGLSLNVDKRNNRIFATKGVYFSAAVDLAGGFRVNDTQALSVLGGEFNFVEARANLRVFQPLIPNSDALVFRLNSSLGAIWSTDGRVIPYIHRYRAGGINSVRGYNWFSLGPTLRVSNTEDPIHGDANLVVGGTQSWINNFELEAPIIRQAGILGVLFFDAGNAFGDPWGNGGINPLGLRMAVGGGIRWRSPMGPLRFEIGFPINPREGEKKSVLDFSIGSFF